MSMSKKHYESLALTVKERMYYLSDDARKLVAADLANWLWREDKSGRFDRQRFIDACGVPVKVYSGGE
jgi:hypothetical protein